MSGALLAEDLCKYCFGTIIYSKFNFSINDQKLKIVLFTVQSLKNKAAKDSKQLAHCFSRGLSIPRIAVGSLLYPIVSQKPTPLHLSCFLCQPAISSAYFQVWISQGFFMGWQNVLQQKGNASGTAFQHQPIPDDWLDVLKFPLRPMTM